MYIPRFLPIEISMLAEKKGVIRYGGPLVTPHQVINSLRDSFDMHVYAVTHPPYWYGKVAYCGPWEHDDTRFLFKKHPFSEDTKYHLAITPIIEWCLNQLTDVAILPPEHAD